MNILLSNDDGYLSPGLACLANVLAPHFDLTVVAPDRDRSGASNSLTLQNPLRPKRAENGFYYVNGTPTDCVHLAITGLMDRVPDMVIAGINHGGNLGDDVLYSGTVAAATEGRFLGFPAIAVSLVGRDFVHFDNAANFVYRLLLQLQEEPLPSDTILNINVPDCDEQEISGIRATRLGHRHKSEPVVKSMDPRGQKIFWVGPAGSEQDADEGTDFHAVNESFISVTPLQVDLTRHHSIPALSDWLGDLQ